MVRSAPVFCSFCVSAHRVPLCCVVRHLKYREYVCVPSALLHLQHPVSTYRTAVYGKMAGVNPVISYAFADQIILNLLLMPNSSCLPSFHCFTGLR